MAIKNIQLPDGTTVPLAGSSSAIDEATEEASGLMSATDKVKLDGISSGANAADVDYDTANHKFTKTVDGTSSDIITAADLKEELGLDHVNNTADLDKPISTATQTALDGKLASSLKGAASGLAELDSNGKVPVSQLPSYVDDVQEYETTGEFPLTGEAGKIYVAQNTNRTYRWGGSDYVEISASLALGETSSTAYRGDRGADAYAHAVTNKGSAFTSGLYKITTNAEGHVTGATAVQKSDITALGIPGSDTTYTFTDNNPTLSWGTKSKVATVGGVDINVTMPANPNTDHYAWSDITGKPSTFAPTIGSTATTAAAGNHTHTLSIATDSGTNQLTMAANTKYKITAGGSTYIFTTPPDNNTTYESKSAASGGTAVSLVTTGEKYTWNNKSNLSIGTTASTAAAGNHTHGLSMATSSGTNQITLAASTKYQLTAGGSTYIFTTPPNTTYSNLNQFTNGPGYITGITKKMVTDALGYTPPTSDTNTTYSAGSNITLSGTTFSLTKANVTGALGYTPLSSHQSLSRCVKRIITQGNPASITFDSSNTWTANADGFLIITINPTVVSGGYLRIAVMGVAMECNSHNDYSQSIMVPVLNGYVVTKIRQGTCTYNAYFYSVAY